MGREATIESAGATVRCSTKLSYAHQKRGQSNTASRLVRSSRARLEHSRCLIAESIAKLAREEKALRKLLKAVGR